MTDIKVRLATPADEEGVVEHSRLLHEENGLFSYDEGKARSLIHRFLDRDGGIVGVIGPVGSLEGSICLSIDQIYYSSDWQMIELFNFVMPPRKGRAGHAKKLLEFAKHCSDHMHLPLSVGILSNSRVAAKVRLYERQFEMAGAFFVHNRQYAGGSAWGIPEGSN